MKNSAAIKEEMFSVIVQWKDSNLSQQEFCRQQRIAYHRFHYWYKRYRAVHEQPDKGTPESFIPLALEAGSGHTEVVMLSGVRIIFHGSVTATFLQQLSK